MALNNAVAYLALWSLIGAVLFSIFVVFVFRSGVVYASRKKDGTLKEKIPFTGYIAMAALLITMMGFFVLANYIGLVRNEVAVGFGTLFLLNLGLYILLFLFDTLFIDGFVLGYWQPSFLNLSNQIGRESMRAHIVQSIPVGLAFGIRIAGLATVVSYLGFMN